MVLGLIILSFSKSILKVLSQPIPERVESRTILTSNEPEEVNGIEISPNIENKINKVSDHFDMSARLGISIFFGIIAYAVLVYFYEVTLFRLFNPHEEFHSEANDDNNLILTNKTKLKKLVFGILVVLPIFPFVLVYYICISCILIIHKRRKKREHTRDILRPQAEILGTKVKDLDQIGNPKTHNFDTVTRYEIDNFIADENEDIIKYFDYLDPNNSFSKILELDDIKFPKDHDEVEHTSCVVCLDQFENNEELILFPCGHYFHKLCLEKYRKFSKKKKSCELENREFRCLLCHLSIIREYQFYKHYELDPKKVAFKNKIIIPRKYSSTADDKDNKNKWKLTSIMKIFRKWC